MIVSPQQAIEIAQQIKKIGKTIVLTGGCFDILHIGHLSLLENAKAHGDILFIFVESDEKIKKNKGEDRPIHTQLDRARMLSALACVDYVIPLPFFKTNTEYDTLVTALQPDIIAITANDPHIQDKKRQSLLIHGKILPVTPYIAHISSSRLAAVLEKEL